jgi:hypothetical protein
MLRKIILAICTIATVNMSVALTGASAAPHGAHAAGGHPGGGHPGGGHVSFGGGGHPGYYGGHGYGGGGYVAAPYGYGYDGGEYVAAPYGYDPGGYYPYGYAPYGYGYYQGYDPGPAIAAGIIGTALGAIIGAQRYHHGCGWSHHHRVCY